MYHLADLKIEINTFHDFLGNPCSGMITLKNRMLGTHQHFIIWRALHFFPSQRLFSILSPCPMTQKAAHGEVIHLKPCSAWWLLHKGLCGLKLCRSKVSETIKQTSSKPFEFQRKECICVDTGLMHCITTLKHLLDSFRKTNIHPGRKVMGAPSTTVWKDSCADITCPCPV